MPDSHTRQGGEESSDERLRTLARIVAMTENLSLPSLQRMERTHAVWVKAKPKELATFIKARNPELSDAEVAYKVVVDRTTLYRSPEYRRLKAMLAATSSMPRGSKDRNGNLEAFADYDDDE
jgi:hypothetical protein